MLYFEFWVGAIVGWIDFADRDGAELNEGDMNAADEGEGGDDENDADFVVNPIVDAGDAGIEIGTGLATVFDVNDDESVFNREDACFSPLISTI